MAVSIARQALRRMAIDPDQSLASCKVRSIPTRTVWGLLRERSGLLCSTNKGRDKQWAVKRKDRCGHHTRVPEEVHGARPVAWHLDINLDPGNQESVVVITPLHTSVWTMLAQARGPRRWPCTRQAWLPERGLVLVLPSVSCAQVLSARTLAGKC